MLSAARTIPSGVRRRHPAVVACLSVGILLSVPPTAVAVNADQFYGIVVGVTTSDAQLQRLGNGGASTVRVNLSWAQADPDCEGANFDWRTADRLITAAARAHVNVLPSLVGNPSCATQGGDTHKPPSYHLDAYDRFIRAAVTRYGSYTGIGTFWREHPGLDEGSAPNVWEVHNEENFPYWWVDNDGDGDGDPNAQQYLGLLKIAAYGIKQTDGNAKVMLGGLTSGPSTARQPEGYLRDLYSLAEDPRPYFDIVALHPYPESNERSSGQGVLAEVQESRTVMNNRGDAETPIWITEVGWGTRGSPDKLSTSENGQANKLDDTYRLLFENGDALKVQRVLWYNDQDIAQNLEKWEQWAGLFGPPGNSYPKAAWNAFVDRTPNGSPGSGPFPP